MKQSDNETIGNSRFETLYPKETRFSEIEKMLSFIKAGNSCQIIGIPGAGRSNILALLSFNRAARQHHLGVKGAKEFHFVYCNFSEVRKKPLTDVLKFIFISLIDSLRERVMKAEEEKISAIFKESLGFSDEQVLFQGLKKAIDYLAIEKEHTIILLFDRFEEYVPSVTPEFFQGIRSLRNRAKYRFSAVFSLNRPLEEMIEPEIYMDMYEFLAGNTIFLSLSDEPSLNFRISYIGKANGKKIDKGLLDKVVFLTAGHGKLTRISLDYLLSNDIKEDLEKNLLEAEKVKAVLLEIWKSLTPEEQELLRKKQTSLLLEKLGLTKDGKITIPLFEMFAKEQTETKRDEIKYDEQTKEIRKGSIVLSEGLTSSEFKLLRFLIENPGKIIERDEIINAVWGELSSTAGVTEQALDQLVFRVRKKIEENPNQPQHIQTIKGRGFKFTA